VIKRANIILPLCLAILVLCAFTTQNGVLTISPISPAEISPPVYDDIRVPLSKAKAVGVSADADFDPFIGTTRAYTFDADTDEELFFTVQMPHNYKYQTNIESHIHWTPTTTNTGTVMWCVDCYLSEWGGTFGALTTLCNQQAGDGTAYKHQLDQLGYITGSAIDTLSAIESSKW